MLLNLAIQDFAVVDHLEIDLYDGMTCITGETGAGKSIMLDALGLCVGDRADSRAIRPGASRTDISACFDVSRNTRAQIWLTERDLLEATGECILRRTITAEGRSRAYINGTPATLSDCADLGQLLVDIHSQHAHQSLLRRPTQRSLLDTYASAQSLIVQVSELAQRWRVLQEEHARLSGKTAESDARKELLTYQIAELETTNPQTGELAELESRHRLLSNAAFIIDAANEIANGCESQRDALAKLVTLANDDRMTSDATINLRELMQSALIQVDEAQAETVRFAASVELDPAGLRETEERLTALHDLARKHRVSAESLPELLATLQAELNSLTGGSEHLEALAGQLEETAVDWRRQAEQLSGRRHDAASDLGTRVMDRLAGLAMGKCVFEVALIPFSDTRPDPRGAEDVEFLIATNPGAAPGPLNKVASGGELSRISLALQVIAADTATSPTIIFDEVDVGIGGGVAEAVGELLQQLGTRSQVLAVTHQPQVAAKGHHHLLVTKEGEDTVHSLLTTLEGKARVEEIGRMLGGAKLTGNTLAHAQEMLNGA
ncbi:MAG: DNA repair protein RecN [Luminiphilus sp.]|jgi:DNA repair protein RecN (Recombination protein N)|nr:DNA repair protein RecN [Luminiphilus sp.]